jgi:hypothetical protein
MIVIGVDEIIIFVLHSFGTLLTGRRSSSIYIALFLVDRLDRRLSLSIIVLYINTNNIYLQCADIGTRIIPPPTLPSTVLDDDHDDDPGPLSGLIKIRGVARIYLLGRLFN